MEQFTVYSLQFTVVASLKTTNYNLKTAAQEVKID